MITIRFIQKGEEEAVKQVIYKVAYNIFGFDGTLEDSIRHYEELGVLDDLKDVQANYFEADGTFLVATNGERVIGSGAIRKIDTDTAELKRMWLLDEYHGQGIGYRLIQKLFDFAHKTGFQRIRLQTSSEQIRALEFYRKLGFYEIPSYNKDTDEVSMEIHVKE